MKPDRNNEDAFAGEDSPVDDIDERSTTEDTAHRVARNADAAAPARRRPWVPIGIAVGVLLVVIGAILLTPVATPPSGDSSRPPPDPGVGQIGARAPDFRLKTIDGGTFRLDEHRGKTVLINFWGTWCPPCEKEMPHLVDAYSRHRDTAVFVGVAVNDVPDAVRRFVTEKNIDFPIGLDEGQIAGRYLVSGFPTTVIIDSEGVVREKIARAFPDIASIDAALGRASGNAGTSPRA